LIIYFHDLFFVLKHFNFIGVLVEELKFGYTNRTKRMKKRFKRKEKFGKIFNFKKKHKKTLSKIT